MIRHIPSEQTRRWTGPYLGNYLGDLWKTFNVDLEVEEGKIQLSRRLDTVADTTDTNSDTLGIVAAFTRANSDCIDRIWALSDALSDTGKLFRVDSSPTGDWQVDSLDSSPARPADMTVFEKDTRGDSLSRHQLFVTTDTDIAVLNDTGTPVWTGNWWTGTQGHAADSALDSGYPHPIEYFPYRRIALVGSRNKIHTISRTSDTVNEVTSVSRLVLPKELQAQHIFTTTNRAWILCANTAGGNGKIVEWDGFSISPNEIHDAFSRVPMSGVSYQEIPIVINNRGMILEYTGRGFAPMIRNGQQVAFPVIKEGFNAFSINPTTFIGSIRPRGMMVGDDGLIYINAEGSRELSHRQVAGIWCLDPTSGRLYNKYSIGQWSGGNTDYGQQEISFPGAIFSIPAPANGFLLAAGQVYSNYSGTTKNGIWVLSSYGSTTATRGYFVTQTILASEVKELWDALWVRFKRFSTAANRIVVKAKGVRSLRNASYLPLDATITWTSATTFTVTLAAGDGSLAVGDEVEILSGDNAGTLSHITAISGAHAALQTITIDETLAASTNSALARFDRWKKLGVISNSEKYQDSVNIGIDSSFIQFKVELRGPATEQEVSDLIINSSSQVYNKK